MRTKGFSLVELVVVILLIGILAAVAVPRLFSSTDKAHLAATQKMQADFQSALNVLRAEWVLNGQPQIWEVDGQQVGIPVGRMFLKMSEYGFPEMSSPDANSMPAATTDDMCITLASQLVGYNPQAFVRLSDLLDPNKTGKSPKALVQGVSWLVLSPESADALGKHAAAAFEKNAAPNPDPNAQPEEIRGSGCGYFYMKAGLFNSVVLYDPVSRIPLLKFDLNLREWLDSEREQLKTKWESDTQTGTQPGFDEGWELMNSFVDPVNTALNLLKQEGDVDAVIAVVSDIITAVDALEQKNEAQRNTQLTGDQSKTVENAP